MISHLLLIGQVREGPYVVPSLAYTLTRFNTSEIRNLTIAPDGAAPVRSIHDRGRLLVHLGDLLDLCGVATPITYGGGDQ